MRYHKGCLIHKYTYLLDDGRDVAVVLLHGLGVLVVLEGRHGGAARSPAPRSHTLICRAALLCLKGAGPSFAWWKGAGIPRRSRPCTTPGAAMPPKS